MLYSASIVAFFIASMAPTTSAGLSAEDMTAIGDGCVNTIHFYSTFKTAAGDTCSSCNFCNGSSLSSLFDPNIDNLCIDCGEVENDCKIIEIVTEFENPWMMKFITLNSSAKSSNEDPYKITIKAYNDVSGWETMHESEVVFDEIKKDQLILFDNNNKIKTYAMIYERKNSSAFMHLGQNEIVESYTKGCTATLHGAITGNNALPYKTSTPTESPTVAVVPFVNNNKLRHAVGLWISDEPAAIRKHGHIKYWDTSQITSMNTLFSEKGAFNEDLSLWDTSSVTDMNNMFFYNFPAYDSPFNSDLSQWNVAQVTSMANMFRGFNSFNSDVSQWNVEKVTNMAGMFSHTTSFHQNLCWNITHVVKKVNFLYGSAGTNNKCD